LDAVQRLDVGGENKRERERRENLKKKKFNY